MQSASYCTAAVVWTRVETKLRSVTVI